MTTLREAAQMALDALDLVTDLTSYDDEVYEAIDTLRAALAADKPSADRLAQPEQEPVAWMYNGNLHIFDPSDWADGTVTPLYNSPPQREVYCGCGDEIVEGDGAKCGTCVAVKYKEKEWVGLTADELNMIGDSMRAWNSHSLTDVYFAIEAKLKEKNT